MIVDRHSRVRFARMSGLGAISAAALLWGAVHPGPALAQGSEPRLLIPPPGGGYAPPTAPASPPSYTSPSYTPPTPNGGAPLVGSGAGAGSAQGGSVPGAGAAAGNLPGPAPAVARLDVRMTQLEQDLRGVTGRLEDVTYQLRKLEDRLSKLAADIEYRLSQSPPAAPAAALPGRAGGAETAGLPPAGSSSAPADGAAARDRATSPGAGAGAESGGSQAAPAPAAPAQTASLPPKTPKEQYARAFSLLEKRNYDEAASGFNDFLKANPDDPLADNARYWLGETYYARGEYARSAELFLNAYEKNKQGPKAPDVLLKLGLSLAGLEKKKEACATFRELNRAFPNAPDGIKDRAGQESKRLACS